MNSFAYNTLSGVPTGVYGDPVVHTPNLDQLAKDGILRKVHSDSRDTVTFTVVASDPGDTTPTVTMLACVRQNGKSGLSRRIVESWH